MTSVEVVPGLELVEQVDEGPDDEAVVVVVAVRLFLELANIQDYYIFFVRRNGSALDSASPWSRV
jgi:hypothetical protein